MDADEFDKEESFELADGLLHGPIDYDFLKSEILEKGPVRQFSRETGVSMRLDIWPCMCGSESCVGDVISVIVEHGVVRFRSTVEHEDLVEHESLTSFFHSFSHYPESFYSSSADEQAIEFEVYRKLNIDPFLSMMRKKHMT